MSQRRHTGQNQNQNLYCGLCAAAGNIGARRSLTSTRGLLTSTGTGSCTCFSRYCNLKFQLQLKWIKIGIIQSTVVRPITTDAALHPRLLRACGGSQCVRCGKDPADGVQHVGKVRALCASTRNMIQAFEFYPFPQAPHHHLATSLIPVSTTSRPQNLYHCSVSADILTEMATAMVSTGLKDAGCNITPFPSDPLRRLPHLHL